MDISKLREPGKLLVLEIGANVKPQAQYIPEYSDGKARVITLDVDPEMHPDVIGDAANLAECIEGKVDGVFASHVLEHFSYWQSMSVLKGWIDALEDGGMLHVLVPSWEWAAREILSENPSPALYGHSFAGQVNRWDVHLAMFTMRRLRAMFEQLGLSVIRARTGEYHLIAGDGKPYAAEQHYICGVKGVPKLSKE